MRTGSLLAAVAALSLCGLQAQAGATAASTTPVVPPPPPAIVVAPPPPAPAPALAAIATLGTSSPPSISAQTLAMAQSVLGAALTNPATLARLGLTAAEVSTLLAQIESIPVRN